MALGALAIAPGAARFLIVVFQIFWHIIMQHKADIGFIYAHAEAFVATMTRLPS